MTLTFAIQSTFSLLLIFSALSVVTSNNPVYSVLSLIACFFNVTCLSIMLGVEFIAVSFIVIYVGAIAVLFLFVLMMLNLKAAEPNQNNVMLLPIVIVLIVAFCFQYFILFNAGFESFGFKPHSVTFFTEFTSSSSAAAFSGLLFGSNNIESIGKVLFTTYSLQFLVTSVILFVAMVCSIVLTLHKRFSLRTQTIHYQILTKHDSLLKSYE